MSHLKHPNYQYLPIFPDHDSPFVTIFVLVEVRNLVGFNIAFTGSLFRIILYSVRLSPFQTACYRKYETCLLLILVLKNHENGPKKAFKRPWILSWIFCANHVKSKKLTSHLYCISDLITACLTRYQILTCDMFYEYVL